MAPHEHTENGTESYEDALSAAWPDVILSLTHPSGFKHKRQELEVHQAFLRTIETMQRLYGSPQAMIDMLRRAADALPDGIELQTLLHFAGRWKSHIENERRLAEQANGTKRVLGEILVAHGNKPNALRTQEEDARRRADRKRNKNKRMIE